MSQINNPPKQRLQATLQINLYEYDGSVTYGGDMGALAREISRICLENEEFAVAMNAAMLVVNDELMSIKVRDELIGMINQ